MLVVKGFEAKLDEPFLFGALELLDGAAGMLRAELAEPCCHANTRIGVDAAVEPLGEGAAEHFFEQLVAMIAGAKAIAVGDEELFPVDGAPDGVVMHGDVELFFEVAEHPEVVVAGESLYFKSIVGQLGELAEEADIALWDNILILEPGIEKIADEIEQAGIGFDGIEPGANAFFALEAGGAIGDAQMKIGSEVNFFALG